MARQPGEPGEAGRNRTARTPVRPIALGGLPGRVTLMPTFPDPAPAPLEQATRSPSVGGVMGCTVALFLARGGSAWRCWTAGGFAARRPA